ncbi:uncharacterized protein [Argopecten irradians]|uniref:uncharacterized protein isoform X2 n=1 Tax=Argopecten irradians TaxID=31199 RepID=UPI00371C5211
MDGHSENSQSKDDTIYGSTMLQMNECQPSSQDIDQDDFDVQMMCFAATAAPRKRTVLSLGTKLEIIRAVEKKDKLKTEIAKDFGITGSTLTGIVKQKEQIMAACDSGAFSPARKRMRHGDFIAVEDALYNWVRKMEGTSVNFKQAISGPVLRQKANDIAKKLGIPGFSSSSGFIERFKKRKGIQARSIGGEKRGASGGAWCGDKVSNTKTSGQNRTKSDSGGRQELPVMEEEEEDKSDGDDNFEIEFVYHEEDDSFDDCYQEAAMHRNKISTQERRMPPSAARGSASEAPVVGQNLSQPKPTSQPIPNKSCNKISREGNKFSASGAVPSLSESAQVTMPDQVTVKEEPEIQELGPEEALNRELGTLEKFREQQKEIEEANKHKKALLAKTLSERQKKARMEAEKLTHIQKELMILDNLLSADVTVVRNRIENASRDFLEATRRYDRAEKEFIEAKLDLQKKSELKEQLTEHLYTIIHQNEIRKAKKLSDLMTELDMETKGEQLCIGNLPPLSAFSSMGMVKVTSPTSPKTPESDSPKVSHSEQKVASPVSSDNKVESTTTVSNATSDDQVRIKTDNSSGESLCLPNDASNDTENTHSEQNQFQISQTRSEENLDNISCPEDFTVNANVEQPSNSSCTDDSSSYNSALSAGADISQSPKHSQNNDSNVAMPSSWTLDSVHIKEEPIT